MKDQFMVDRFENMPTLLFGVGAQKSGTTWLYNLLKTHPECHCSETKELHYFDVLHRKGEQTHLTQRVELLQKLTARAAMAKEPTRGNLKEQMNRISRLIDMYPEKSGNHSKYLSILLDGYVGQKIACDITPSYSTLDRVIFREMSSLGPSQFIFIMRDPVDRMWSQIRMAVAHSTAKLSDEAFQDACVARARDLHASGRLPKIPRANYDRTMVELEAVIPSDKIMYIIFEKMFDPEAITRLWRFLRVQSIDIEAKIPANTGKSASLPADVEHLLFEGLRHQYEVVFNRFGMDVPAEWRDRYRACKRSRPTWLGRLLGR